MGVCNAVERDAYAGQARTEGPRRTAVRGCAAAARKPSALSTPPFPNVAGIELQRLLRPAIARPSESSAASYDRLSAWAGDLTALHELTGRLARTTELTEALYEIVRAGAELVGARRGFAVLQPADGRGPDVRAGYGIGAAELGAMETVPRASTSYGRLLDATAAARPADVCRPDLAAEPDLHPRHRDVAVRLGYAAGYAVPLAAAAPRPAARPAAGPGSGAGPAGAPPAGAGRPGAGQPDQGGMAQPGQKGSGQRDAAPPGQPWPGRRGPGQPWPGQPGPGQPEDPAPGQPGQQGPGRPEDPAYGQPGQPDPGQPGPGRPGPGLPAPAQPEDPTHGQPGQPGPGQPGYRPQGPAAPGRGRPGAAGRPAYGPGAPGQPAPGRPGAGQPVPAQPGGTPAPVHPDAAPPAPPGAPGYGPPGAGGPGAHPGPVPPGSPAPPDPPGPYPYAVTPYAATPHPGPPHPGPPHPGPPHPGPPHADSPHTPAPVPASHPGAAQPALLGAVEWLYDEPARPTDRQRRIAGLYARHAGDHLARLLDLTRARTAADGVRAALLPARLPRVPGARVAVRHRSGPLGGGDFYDVLPLPDGALGLAVGSAGGGGPAAVAAMGQLRTGLRAYAVMEGEDPVAVLSDLELLMRLTEPGRRATALFAYAPPGRRSIVVAGAGHCPPLVTGPWRTEYAETSLSAPLNMLTCWEAPSVTIDPAPGETVLLYTDGLLHRTGRPAEQAMTRLHHAAATAPAPVRDDPEALTDHVLARLLPAGPGDGEGADHPEDVVLLAVQLTG